MSSTSSAAASATSCGTSFIELLNCGAGTAAEDSGQSFYTLLAAIYTAAASFGAQFLLFLFLRMRLSRIYQPKTYLVAERERVHSPPRGLYQWIVPMFVMPDAAIIQKCGLDAYFFLRYLYMLLKIFIPLTILILPVLLPINETSGNGSVQGVDLLGWQNIAPRHIQRTWAHLVLACVVVAWVLYVIYEELRGYIRIRQAYLTSPQHRLRASATTVLVRGIPKKWLTLEALNGLYDVFPGGIRNIWINRNFDELATKVKKRNSLAKSLESAETSLIRNCVQKQREAEAKKAKKEGQAKKTKEQKEQEQNDRNQEAEDLAQGQGVSSGDPHQTPHNIHEAIDEIEDGEADAEDKPSPPRRILDPLGKIGDGLGAGLGALGHGFGNMGRAMKKLPGDMTGGVNRALHDIDHTVSAVNDGPGFGAGFVMEDDSVYKPAPQPQPRPAPHKLQHAAVAANAPSGRPRTPEPKSSVSQVSPTSPSDRPTGLRRPHSPSGIAVMERAPPTQEPFESPSAPESASTSNKTSSPKQSTSERPLTNQHKFPREAPGRAKRLQEQIEQHQRQRHDRHQHDSVVQKTWRFFSSEDEPIPFPSPQPHTLEENEFPLRDMNNKHPDLEDNPNQEMSKSKWGNKFGWLAFWRKSDKEEDPPEVYPEAYNEDLAEDQDGEPLWKQYMEEKDRDTIRARLVNQDWFPRLPFLGKKMDKIYYLRRELARLNVEIEQDQDNVEKFPFMNSAFIQFNHQVAAHMACQSLSHHVPHHMTPRIVEISPDDIIWDNMSMKWWEEYLRVGIVFGLAIALTIFYAIPVAFTGFLSQINYVAGLFSWLSWLAKLPTEAKAIIQGVLPPLLLSLILTLVPIIFRYLTKLSGVPTGSEKEAGVQVYYFVFLFIQVFLIASLSTGLITFIEQFTGNVTDVTTTLAKNLPNASDYFFSYLTVQALSNSASALLQIKSLFLWFLWAPVNDSTARQKWRRQTKLQNVKWGSFFPQFTNYAVIGIIFSIIAPLIMVFNLMVFSLYWFSQRYNVLYVYQFQMDTGGLLFPTAINQLMTGVYVMEICLIGLFFIAKNEAGDLACIPQAVIMIVVFVITIVYQWLLNDAFRPLFRYLPITLEDDAVIRDEEFARAQSQKFERMLGDDGENGESDDMIQALEEQERLSNEQERLAIEDEERRIREYKRSQSELGSQHNGEQRPAAPRHNSSRHSIMDTKPPKSRTEDRWNKVKNLSAPAKQLKNMANVARLRDRRTASGHTATTVNPQTAKVDPESQRAVGDVLYSGFSDELEDLTPEERDTLIRYSFQHSALRARRPVVWLPRDPLGISDDEIERCKLMSTVEHVDADTEKRDTKTSIWMSNDGAALDAKGRVVFRRSPPDFANVDLIAL